jgi:hypothetical protein
MGIDFRALNTVTKFQVYLLPRVEDTISCLRGNGILSILDSLSGGFHVEIDEEQKQKTAFSIPGGGHLKYKKLCFAICRRFSGSQTKYWEA